MSDADVPSGSGANVSRETPAVPAVARRVFASRLGLAERYAELLATEATVRGLIGPREVPRLWERHLLNCAVLADLIPEGASVADIGSGAGLPGLVLAIRRPDVQVTLVEPLLRRTTFLEEVVSELGLDGVQVVRGRADSLHGKQTFDVVTSRAVAPLGRLLDWSMPLVDPIGALVAMKGSSAEREVEEAAADLAAWGCAEPEIVELGHEVVEQPTCALMVSWDDPAAVGSPPVRADRRTPAATSSKKRRARPRRRK